VTLRSVFVVDFRQTLTATLLCASTQSIEVYTSESWACWKSRRFFLLSDIFISFLSSFSFLYHTW